MAAPEGARARRRESVEALLAWWGVNRRDFPWRHWTDPYRLLVSEILLRQTRAETVAGFVQGFLETYRTPNQLTAASEDELAAILRPLGFSRQRARQLGSLAAVLDEEKPVDLSPGELGGLPGIGRYSAAMVAAARGSRVAAVDTNVARVVCRVFGVVPSHAEARKSVNVWAEAESLVAAGDGPAIHVTWALLDLGATVCRERRPRCPECPLRSWCAYARKESGVAQNANREYPAAVTSGLPYWQDPAHGGRKRAACWLATKVGEGETYTVEQLRTEVTNDTQIDRRGRELREFGWIIHNYRDEEGLERDQHRLVKVGVPIWEESAVTSAGRRVSAAVRRAVLNDDQNRCRLCGIAPGEHYKDDPGGAPARLTLGHLRPRGGNEPSNLRAECARCNEPVRHLTANPPDVDGLKDRVHELGKAEREALARWLDASQRDFSKVDDLWFQIRPLPAPLRREIREYLKGLATPAKR